LVRAPGGSAAPARRKPVARHSSLACGHLRARASRTRSLGVLRLSRSGRIGARYSTDTLPSRLPRLGAGALPKARDRHGRLRALGDRAPMIHLLRLPLLAVLLLIPFHPMMIAHILPARLGIRSLALAMWKEYLLLITLCCGAVIVLAQKRLPSLTTLDWSILLFVSYCLLSVPFAPSPLAGIY